MAPDDIDRLWRLIDNCRIDAENEVGDDCLVRDFDWHNTFLATAAALADHYLAGADWCRHAQLITRAWGALGNAYAVSRDTPVETGMWWDAGEDGHEFPVVITETVFKHFYVSDFLPTRPRAETFGGWLLALQGVLGVSAMPLDFEEGWRRSMMSVLAPLLCELRDAGRVD